MALYQDGILISGANTLPKMTLAEYNALPADQRPTYWERLDADYDDILAEKTDIGNVESGTTASRAYSTGELVYVSGTLYRVKTAIASGATFTVGTNIETTNVSDAIDDKISSTKTSNQTISSSLILVKANSTTSVVSTDLILGNNIPNGTTGSSAGRVQLYGAGSNRTILRAFNSTAERTINFPDKSGTVALTSDIPTDDNWTLLSGATLPTYYRKVNGIVFVMFVASNYTVSSTGFIVGTLPSGYRPPYTTGTRSNQINTNNDAGFEISTTGDITCRTNNTGSGRYFYATIAYPPA